MYVYAKRPRTRAANRVSRPDRPIGETKPNFLNDYMGGALGWEFIDENGGGPGVRLKKSTKGKGRK